MGKHKKTLAEKKRSDTRKNYNPSPKNLTGSLTFPTSSLPTYQFATNISSKQHISSSESLTHGLEKTLIVSSVIVILQLAFFFLLTHHILVLPWKVLQY